MKYIFPSLVICFIFSFLSLSSVSAGYNEYSGKAVIKWVRMNNAVSFNIYYKELRDPEFKYAVSNIPGNSTNYTINFLKSGKTYVYRITALDGNRTEFAQTKLKRINSSWE